MDGRTFSATQNRRVKQLQMASSAVLPTSLLREFLLFLITLKFNNPSNSVKKTFPPTVLILRKSVRLFKHTQAFLACPSDVRSMKLKMENWWNNRGGKHQLIQEKTIPKPFSSHES